MKVGCGFPEENITGENVNNTVTQLTPENLDKFISTDSAGLIRVGEGKIPLSDETMNAISKYSNSIRFATLNVDLFDEGVLESKGLSKITPSVQMVQNNRVFQKINGTVKGNIAKVNWILSVNGTAKK